MRALSPLAAGAWVWLCVLVAHPAEAATFSFVQGAAEPLHDGSFVRLDCNIRLEGEIVTGDAARFETFIAEIADRIEHHPTILGNPKIATLCLDSTGGSLDEGIKLAEAIRRDRPFPYQGGLPFIATRLEAGAHCASACAIAFMAGTIDDWEGEAFPARSMHPTARLGFHAPALVVPTGNYDEGFIASAYDTSISSIAAVLRVLHVGEAADGTDYSGTRPWMETSLLEVMLRTPSDQMRYLQTVDDVGRWQIDVAPFVPLAADDRSLFRACVNGEAWRDGRPSFTVSPMAYQRSSDYLPPEITQPGVTRAIRFGLNELDGIYCDIFFRADGQFTAFVDGVLVARGPNALALYEPTTQLADIAPDTPATEQESADATGLVPWAPRFGGDRLSLWDHNGSQMAWESRGTRRWIWYYQPRAGLAEAGVRSGTLLFDGSFSDDWLSGTARRFSGRCGVQTFAVGGRVTGSSVVIEGTYSSRNSACEQMDTRRDTLEFTYIDQQPTLASSVIASVGTAPVDLMQITGVRTGLNFRIGPSSNSAILTELPPNLANIRLLGCTPAIRQITWDAASAAIRLELLAASWCSLSYRGQTGFVSGRYLMPQ